MRQIEKIYGGDRIYEGLLKGEIIKVAHGVPASSFVLKIDENIEGIPKEISCFLVGTFEKITTSRLGSIKTTFRSGHKPFLITQGDKVSVKGRIYTFTSPEWQKESFYMLVYSLYNETLKCEF